MGGVKPGVREILLDSIARHDGVTTTFHKQDVNFAFGVLPRKLQIDQHGVPILALQCLFYAQPERFIAYLNTVLACSASMSMLSVFGRPLGKLSNISRVQDVRLILPQCSLMSLLDALLSKALNEFIDDKFPRVPNDHVFVGARPKTQVLDITFTCQTAVEKGIDNASNCALAQGDISKYYDSLPLFRLYRWLIEEGFDSPVLHAVFRHQALTSVFVVLRHSVQKRKICGRSIGGLTGSRTAGALARIPVESMLMELKDRLEDRAFLGRVSLGVFIDNVFLLVTPSVARSAS